MPRATFSTKGTGTAEDPYTADLSSVTGAGQKAVIVQIHSITRVGGVPTQFDVTYFVYTLPDGSSEKLVANVKGLTTKAEAGTISAVETRKAISEILRFLTKGNI